MGDEGDAIHEGEGDGADCDAVRAGDLFGPFRVVGVIASGGMGTVARAVHTTTGEAVALKTIRARTPAALRSLDREIAALRRIDHPNVVSVVDAGRRDGIPWVAMALVDGEPLRVHLARWSTVSGGAARTVSLEDDLEGLVEDLPEVELDPAQLQRGLDLFHRLCAPLAWLHVRGFVHGDLKPENVVVTPEGEPVLVDLGLLRASGEDGRDVLDAVRAGGTPEYLSPEVCAGAAPDARADLYALGCMLYELAAGRPPFVGSPAVVLRYHREVVPPPLPAGVPAGYEALVLGLLAKDPRDRIGYAADAARALAELGAAAFVAVDDRPYLYRSPLVGRGDEVAALAEVLHGGASVVTGPPGAGRTRVVGEAARRCGRRVFAAEARGGPLVGQVLREAVARAASSSSPSSVFAGHGAALAAYEPAIRAWYDGDEPVDPATAGLRIVTGAVHAARELDAAVVIDDVDRADEAGDALGVELAFALIRARVPVIVTAAVDAPIVGRLVDAGAARLDLGPLPDDALTEIATASLAVRQLPPELTRYVVRGAGGSPGFVAELVRSLVDARRLVRRDGRWAIAARDGLDAVALPSGIAALAADRVARVPPEARSALVRAAFAAVDPLPDVPWVEALVACGVLDRDLRFTQRAIGPVARATATPTEVAEAHGWWLAHLPADAPDAAFATHLAGVGRTEDAVVRWRRAAQAADARFDVCDVERCATELLALDPDAADVRLRYLARAVLRRRRVDEAIAHARRAGEDARRLGAHALAIEAAIDEANAHCEVRRFDVAVALAEDAADRARAAGDRALELRAGDSRAVALGEQGRAAEAIEALGAICAGWAEIGDATNALRSEVRRANLLHRIGRDDEALPVLTRAAPLVEARDPGVAATAYAALALGLANAYRVEASLDAADSALRAVRRAGALGREGYALLVSASALRMADRLPEALARLDEGGALAEELGDARLRATAAYERLHVLHQMGRRADALDVAIPCAEQLAALGMSRLEAHVWLLVAQIALDDGDVELAARVLDRAENGLLLADDHSGFLVLAVRRGWVALRRGYDARGFLGRARAMLASVGEGGVFAEQVARLSDAVAAGPTRATSPRP